MPASFDRVARSYRALEYCAFGRTLERARFDLLPSLQSCRDILVLGEGDGRCLAQLLRVAPAARVHVVEGSAAMIALARARVPSEDRPRARFDRADIRQLTLAPASYDAVVTMFVLDCLSDSEVEQLVRTTQRSLRPGARWLFADFAMPERGWPRLMARLITGGLYAFFRWQAGVAVRALPASEAILAAAGWRTVEAREYHGRLIRTVVLQHDG